MEGGGNGTLEGMGILLGRASIIKCYCHAKGQHSVNIISQISITGVYIKPEIYNKIQQK